MRRFLFITLALASCAIRSNLAGTYQKQGKHFNYQLTLAPDSSFVLIKNDLDVSSGCEGRWVAKNDTILLRCNDEDKFNQLIDGYMFQRNLKLPIINSKHLKFGKAVLAKRK